MGLPRSTQRLFSYEFLFSRVPKKYAALGNGLRCVLEFVMCFPCKTGSSSSSCHVVSGEQAWWSHSHCYSLLSVVHREQKSPQKVMAGNSGFVCSNRVERHCRLFRFSCRGAGLLNLY